MRYAALAVDSQMGRPSEESSWGMCAVPAERVRIAGVWSSFVLPFLASN